MSHPHPAGVQTCQLLKKAEKGFRDADPAVLDELKDPYHEMGGWID